jgi:hypothetical protein
MSLIHEEENDYILKKNELSCWITVDNISVHVMRQIDRDCVRVELFPLGKEGIDREPIDYAQAYLIEGM